MSKALNDLYKSLINKFNNFSSQSILSYVDGVKINIYFMYTNSVYKIIIIFL